MNRSRTTVLSLAPLMMALAGCPTPPPAGDAGDAAVPDVASDAVTPPRDAAPGDAAPNDGSTPADAADAATPPADVTTPPGDAGDASPPPVDGGACMLETSYTYGLEGGLVAFVDRASLAPARAWRFTRMPRGGATLECAQTLLACGVGDAIDTGDVLAAFAHPDVQAAFAMATPPLYGRDTRPVDGAIFQVRRVDGRGVDVGSACGGPGSCTEIPPGVAALRTLLTALDSQERARPGCEALR